jgi:hypothetical protein
VRIRKFTTAGWKLTVYITLFAYGLYALLLDNQIYASSSQHLTSTNTQESFLSYLFGKGWLASGGVIANYNDWPAIRLRDINHHQSNATSAIDSPILNHYILALAYYLYATLLVVFDLEGVRQNDKWEMTLHHLVTIFLIAFSWQWKLYRAGGMILVLHDFADPLMEVAKLMLYTGRQLAANIWFGLFATGFIITRCLIFPAIIIWPTVYAIS